MQLRRKEFDLLSLLVENAGRVLTRDVLIDRVWGSDYIGDTKTLDVHIKRLRSQIEVDPAEPTLITTVRGRRLPLRRPEPLSRLSRPVDHRLAPEVGGEAVRGAGPSRRAGGPSR